MRAIPIVYALLILLAACAGLEQPKSLQEQMLYTQYGLVAATETAVSLKERGKISQDEALKIDALVGQADFALKTARGLDKPEDAMQWLQTANSILLELETYLRSKQ